MFHFDLSTVRKLLPPERTSKRTMMAATNMAKMLNKLKSV